MSTIQIPEDVLREAGLTEQDAVVELACRLFQGGRLTLWQAARLAGLDRNGIEDALLERHIPVYRPSAQDLKDDLRNLDEMGV
jgi:predicted HTH domain antitoxin